MIGSSVRRAACLALLLVVSAAFGPAPEPFSLQLPTSNDALFSPDEARFYQHVNRYFRGQRTQPWEAGRYGFVRNPQSVGGKLVFTRLHEGIDVRPLHRGEDGVPLDTVRAISSGEVVYVNSGPRKSNYGRYVVVEHRWDGSPFFSLYAHLGSISVEPGTHVGPGEGLGVMGYSGAGLSRDRAHLHLEVGMLLNETFEPWYDAHFHDEPNYHSIYSGLNLAGLDVAALYAAYRADSSLTVREFVRSRPVAYELTIPDRGGLDLIRRYPWLLDRSPTGDVPAWTISFTRAGLPVRVEGSARPVDRPVLEQVEPEIQREHLCYANGYLDRRSDRCVLTRQGRRYGELFMQ